MPPCTVPCYNTQDHTVPTPCLPVLFRVTVHRTTQLLLHASLYCSVLQYTGPHSSYSMPPCTVPCYNTQDHTAPTPCLSVLYLATPVQNRPQVLLQAVDISVEAFHLYRMTRDGTSPPHTGIRHTHYLPHPPPAGRMARAVNEAPPPVPPAVKPVCSEETGPRPPPVSVNAPRGEGRVQ